MLIFTKQAKKDVIRDEFPAGLILASQGSNYMKQLNASIKTFIPSAPRLIGVPSTIVVKNNANINFKYFNASTIYVENICTCFPLSELILCEFSYISSTISIIIKDRERKENEKTR